MSDGGGNNPAKSKVSLKEKEGLLEHVMCMGKEWSQPTRQGDSGSCNSKDSVGAPGREGGGQTSPETGRGWQHTGGPVFSVT